jgi:hypothetical protein
LPRKKRDLLAVKPITEWDDEELEKGRLKNQYGKFDGRPPAVPPKLFQQIRDEKYKRKLSRARDKLIAGQEDAADVVNEIARDENAPYKDRLAAALALLDRGFGKPVQPVALQAAIAVGVPVPGVDVPAGPRGFEGLAAKIMGITDDEFTAELDERRARIADRAGSGSAEVARLEEENRRLRAKYEPDSDEYIADAEIVEDADAYTGTSRPARPRSPLPEAPPEPEEQEVTRPPRHPSEYTNAPHEPAPVRIAYAGPPTEDRFTKEQRRARLAGGNGGPVHVSTADLGPELGPDEHLDPDPDGMPTYGRHVRDPA